MSRIEELHALRKRAKAMKARLQLLNKRIGEIQDGPGTRDLKAVVDSEQCVACGICADQCPEGAILIYRTAHVDPRWCKGCGLCVDECPRGAISLYPTFIQGLRKTAGI